MKHISKENERKLEKFIDVYKERFESKVRHDATCMCIPEAIEHIFEGDEIDRVMAHEKEYDIGFNVVKRIFDSITYMANKSEHEQKDFLEHFGHKVTSVSAQKELI